MTDHATGFSAAALGKSKKKEEVIGLLILELQAQYFLQ